LDTGDNVGVTQMVGHHHFQQPTTNNQQLKVNPLEKFLLNSTKANTQVQKNDGTFPVEISHWVNWETLVVE